MPGKPAGVPKTGIFWDCEDYLIPGGLDYVAIHQNVKGALKEMGYFGKTSSLVLYAEDQHFEDEELERLKAGGINFRVDESRTGRVKLMLEDIRKWAIDNPVEGEEKHNLMVALEGIVNEAEIMSVLNDLKSKGYNVCLVHDDESAEWLWRSLFYGEADVCTCPYCGASQSRGN